MNNNLQRLGVGLLLLSTMAGCASNNHIDANKHDIVPGLSHLPTDAEGRKLNAIQLPAATVKDIQSTLEDRNLYFTPSLTPAFVNDTCQLDVYSKAGHFSHPDYSDTAIVMGNYSGFSGLNLDLRLTRDNFWVVHSDKYTGRATGHNSGKRLEVARIKGTDWNNIFIRGTDGHLTKEQAPWAVDAFKIWSVSKHHGQKLNISIPIKADYGNILNLYRMVTKYLPENTYIFSSTSLQTLKYLRAIDKKVYLGYVWEPDGISIEQLKNVLRKEARTDALYNKGKRKLDWLDNYERKNRKRNFLSAKNIASVLGTNSGLHVDIRNFARHSTIQSRAKAEGLKVMTYSINGPEYHINTLNQLKQQGRTMPDGAILRESRYKLCATLQPSLIKQKHAYHPNSPEGKWINRLPDDADFSQINAQEEYLKEDLYLAIDGKVNSIFSQQKTKPKVSASLAKNTKTAASKSSSTFDVVEDEFDINSVAPVIISIPQ